MKIFKALHYVHFAFTPISKIYIMAHRHKIKVSFARLQPYCIAIIQLFIYNYYKTYIITHHLTALTFFVKCTFNHTYALTILVIFILSIVGNTFNTLMGNIREK